MKKFSEIIRVVKIAGCKTCSTFSYHLPCKITKSIEDHLKPFGELKYPLSHVKIVDIDNEFLKISQARVGGNKMKVKFKKNIEDMKRLFEIHLASFVEVEMGFEIDMED